MELETRILIRHNKEKSKQNFKMYYANGRTMDHFAQLEPQQMKIDKYIQTIQNIRIQISNKIFKILLMSGVYKELKNPFQSGFSCSYFTHKILSSDLKT